MVELAAIGKILQQKIAGEHRALLVFLIWDLEESLCLANVSSGAHVRIFPFAAAITIALQIWMVVELFNRWAYRYKGIGSYGRKLLAICLSGSALLGILITVRTYGALDWVRLLLPMAESMQWVFTIRTWEMVTLALFLACIWIFFRWIFSEPASSNLVLHTATLGFIFTMLSVRAFLFNYRVISFPVAQNGLAIVWTVCFATWAIGLSKAGELTKPWPKAKPEDAAAIERLDRELQAGLKSVVNIRAFRRQLNS